MFNEYFDGRFTKDQTIIKWTLCEWITKNMFTNEDLKMVAKAAEKLKIDPSLPTVEVLYQIACKLSVLENEIVSPLVIMDKIKEFLKESPTNFFMRDTISHYCRRCKHSANFKYLEIYTVGGLEFICSECKIHKIIFPIKAAFLWNNENK